MTPDEMKKLIGKTVRVWDAQHATVFAEGEVVGFITGPSIIVSMACDCGRPQRVAQSVTLPIDVNSWLPREMVDLVVPHDGGPVPP